MIEHVLIGIMQKQRVLGTKVLNRADCKLAIT